MRGTAGRAPPQHQELPSQVSWRRAKREESLSSLCTSLPSSCTGAPDAQRGSRPGGSQPPSLPPASADSPLPRPPCVSPVTSTESRGCHTPVMACVWSQPCWPPCMDPLQSAFAPSQVFGPSPSPWHRMPAHLGAERLHPYLHHPARPRPKALQTPQCCVALPRTPPGCAGGGGHHPHTAPLPTLGLHTLALGPAKRLWVSPPLLVASGCRGTRGLSLIHI